MKISKFIFHPYTIPLTKGTPRSGLIIQIMNREGQNGYGDIAPLPSWSQETLEEAKEQIEQTKNQILAINWTRYTCFKQLKKLSLFPSVAFGLESALLSLLSPLPKYTVAISALFMGSTEEVFKQAKQRQREGYTSAKLKVGHLSFSEAKELILKLKDLFHLRIDVNRAWTTEESLRFFAQFTFDAFDYVEEPFQNPHDLAYFPRALAVDESFPHHLSLKELETLPTLKALIYKPTLQGGLAYALNLASWCKKQKISLVLSSSFESDIGLGHIASMAHRLKLTSPIGTGTQAYLEKSLIDLFRN
jgi:O-succinylbenzoate synthase